MFKQGIIGATSARFATTSNFANPGDASLKGILPSHAMCWARRISSLRSFRRIVDMNLSLWTPHQRKRFSMWCAMQILKRHRRKASGEGFLLVLARLHEYDSQQERESEGLMQ